MSRDVATRQASSGPRSRAGFALRGLMFLVPVGLVVAAIAWYGLPQLSISSEDDGPMLVKVTRGNFVHDITENGNVESANNVEIASKVKSSGGGTTILEIVPEGTRIWPEEVVPEDAVIPLEAIEKLEVWRKEQGLNLDDVTNDRPRPAATGAESAPPERSSASPGDAASETTAPAESTTSANGNGHGGGNANGDAPSLEPVDQPGPNGADDAPPVLTFEQLKSKMILVRLNSASLETKRTQQQITCENSRARVTQAQSSLDTAIISKQEYLEGSYIEKKKDLESKRFVAQENLARAEQYLAYSKRLHGKGYISDRELQANTFDVDKRNLELEKADTSLTVLDDYTKPKMLKQLEATIETAKARLTADTKSYELDMEELEEFEEQMVHCTIFANNPGQVVYANQRGHRQAEVVIEPGTVIRERQVIIRLPDPSQMQVNAKINESRISLVKSGMKAVIRLDAILDQTELEGTVEEVGDYPAPTSWYNASVKEYETIIRIDNPPPELRPGFTAEVRIRVDQQPGVLQLPVQAILEQGGKHFCIVRGKGDWEVKQVTLGSTNEKHVVIREEPDGLSEGDEVVHNAGALRDQVGLTGEPEVVSPEGGPPGSKGNAQRGQGAKGAKGAKGGSRAGRGASGGPSGGGSGGSAMGGGANPADFFKRLDKNGDKKLQRDELPSPMQQRLTQLDTNKDGAIDSAEWAVAAAAMKRMRAAAGGASGGHPGGQAPGGRPKGGAPGGRSGGRPRGGR